MNFAAYVCAVALFCQAVSACGGFRNLVAKKYNEYNGFVDILLEWVDSPESLSLIYIRSPDGSLKYERSAESYKDRHHVETWLYNKEFWTKYEIIVRKKDMPQCSLATEFYTGPGAPHAVEEIRTAAGSSSANISVIEAFMPRAVDNYHIQYCWLRERPESCMDQIFTRSDQNEIASPFTMLLTELKPQSRYEMRIRAEIRDGNQSFMSDPKLWEFYTQAEEGSEPQNLIQTSVIGTTISLRWGISKFPSQSPIKFFLVSVHALSLVLKFSKFITSNAIVLNGLEPLTEYQVKVQSCLVEDESSCGPPVFLNARTELGAPSEPTNVHLTGLNETTAVISWSEPLTTNGPVDGYEISVTPFGAANLVWLNVSRDGCVYEASNLNSGTGYNVHLRAYNEDEDLQRLRSPVAVMRFSTFSEKFTPQHLRQVGRTSSSVSIRWESPETPTGAIEIYDVEVPEKAYRVFTRSNGIVVEDLLPYTRSLVLIRSCFREDVNFCDAAAQIEAETSVGVPSKPTRLTWTVTDDANVLVRWKEPETKDGPIDGYEISVAELQNEVSNWTDVGKSDNSFEIPHPVISASFYTVRVVAYNLETSFERLRSEPAVMRFVTFPEKLSPQNVRQIGKTSNSVILQWEAPEIPEGAIETYDVEVPEKAHRVFTRSNEIVVRDLLPYTKSLVLIRSCFREDVESCGASAQIQAETSVDAPSKPTWLTWTVTDDANVLVRWKEPETKNGPMDGYEISVAELGSEVSNWTDVGKSDNSYEIPHPVISVVTYIVRVVAYNLDTNLERVRSEPAVISDLIRAPIPRNINQIAQTPNSVTIRWEVPESFRNAITCFQIVGPKYHNRVFSPRNEFTLNDLLPYTQSTVSIRSCGRENPDFCGDFARFDIETAVDAPSEPIHVAIVNISSTEASFSWEAPTTRNGPIDGYEISIAADGTSESPWFDVQASQYNASDLTPGSAYTMKLLAFNLDTNGARLRSEAVSRDFETNSPVVPGILPPRNFRQVDRTRDSVSLKWEAPTLTQAWTFFLQITGARIVEISTFTKDSEFLVESLQPYTEYEAALRSCLSSNLKDCGDPVKLNAKTDVDVPSKPTMLQVAYIEESNALATWDEPTTPNGPIDGYEIAISGPGFESLDWIEIAKNDPQFRASNLAIDATYTVFLTAYNLDKNLRRLQSEIAETHFSTPPRRSPPHNVRQVGRTASSVTLRWEAPEGPDFDTPGKCYLVEVPRNSHREFTEHTKIVVRGLLPYTQTRILIRSCARKDVDSCGHPEELTASTAVSAPSEPTGLNLTDVASNSALLEWEAPGTPNGPVDGYEIFIVESRGGYHNWIEVGHGKFSFRVLGLAAASEYNASILAYNLDENSERLRSGTIKIFFSTPSDNNRKVLVSIVFMASLLVIIVFGLVCWRCGKTSTEKKKKKRSAPLQQDSSKSDQ